MVLAGAIPANPIPPDPAQADIARAARALSNAQKHERQRVAAWLREATHGHLAALSRGLAALAKLELDGLALATVEEMNASLRDAVKDTHAMACLVRPDSVGAEGLEAATRAFAAAFAERTGLAVRVTVSGDVDRARAAVQHAVFRVIQEALSNVARHARAQHVTVALTGDRALLRASVTDDGVGFDPPGSDGGEGVVLGVGIPGMRGRMEQLGGRLEITSTASGAWVCATVALEPSRGRAPPRGPAN
ncbi:MAG: sensor histidine kinase [Phenylobacterium sp.]